MTKRDVTYPDDLELEALFEAAQDEVITPSDALLARVMADAEAEIVARADAAAAARAVPSTPVRHPIIAALMTALGGWRSVAGLATAGVAGLVIGLGAPMSYATSDSYDITVSADGSGYAVDDLMSGFYDLAGEG